MQLREHVLLSGGTQAVASSDHDFQ